MEAVAREAILEPEEGARVDRLGAAEGDAPGAEIDPREVLFPDARGDVAVGEVRRRREGPLVARDGVEPRRGLPEETAGRQEDEIDAPVDREEEAADEPHVVVQRKPADDDVSPLLLPHTRADLRDVGQEVAVREADPLGEPRRARSALEEGEIRRGRSRGESMGLPRGRERGGAVDERRPLEPAERVVRQPRVRHDVVRVEVGADRAHATGKVVEVAEAGREGEGRGDGADEERGEERDHELGRRGEDDGERRPLPHASLTQHAREARAPRARSSASVKRVSFSSSSMNVIDTARPATSPPRSSASSSVRSSARAAVIARRPAPGCTPRRPRACASW